MVNRRKIVRRYLLYFVRVYNTSTTRQIGNLVDITPQGIMILGQEMIPEGKIIKLRMELTKEVAEKPFMELWVCSKWCHPDLDPSMYIVGFEIQKIEREDEIIIQKINDTFGFRDNEPMS